MKLILLTDVDDLGKKGEQVDVSDGYARNFLLPRKKAIVATEGALEQAEKLRAAREESERKAKEEATRVASQLTGVRVVLAAQAGDEGKLYGSVGRFYFSLPTDLNVRVFTANSAIQCEISGLAHPPMSARGDGSSQ